MGKSVAVAVATTVLFLLQLLSVNNGQQQLLQGLGTCRSCPAGKFSPSSGSSFCMNCTVCARNISVEIRPCTSTMDAACSAALNTSTLLRRGFGNCTSCPMGTYSDASGSTMCFACRAGQYSAKTASTSCLLCPEGKSSRGTF